MWITHVLYLHHQVAKSPHTYAFILVRYLLYAFTSLTYAATVYTHISCCFCCASTCGKSSHLYLQIQISLLMAYFKFNSLHKIFSSCHLKIISFSSDAHHSNLSALNTMITFYLILHVFANMTFLRTTYLRSGSLSYFSLNLA